MAQKNVTKKEMAEALRTMRSRVNDKSLGDRIDYTLKAFDTAPAKVGKTDLTELIADLGNYLAQEQVIAENLAKKVTKSAPTPVEASLKPKKIIKKSGETKEIAPEEVAEAEAPKDKKPLKKAKVAEKKPVKKEQAKVEEIPSNTTVGVDNLPAAKIFPEEIDHKELGVLTRASDIASYEQVNKALADGETLYFACYWTKRQIKEFSYAAAKMISPKLVSKGFVNDLDILVAVLALETTDRVFALSAYTEALFQFEGEDFTYVEDTDPRKGDTFKVRVSAGMEFELYRPKA